MNFVSGFKTTTLSPYQLDYAAKQAMQDIAKEGGYGRVYENPYIDRMALAELLADGKITEEQFRQALNMQGFYRSLGRKRKGTREEQKLERVREIQSAGVF